MTQNNTNAIAAGQVVTPTAVNSGALLTSGLGNGSNSPVYVMFYREPGEYDILYDFFGPGFHALMSAGGNFFEFRDRFGIIWIQMQSSEDFYSKAKPWKPIDREKFFEFVKDSKQIAFHSSAILSPAEVLKLMSEPNNE